MTWLMIVLEMHDVVVLGSRRIVKEDKTFCVIRVLDDKYDVYEFFFVGDSSVMAQMLEKGKTYDLVLKLSPAYRGSGFSVDLDDYRVS